MTSCLGIGAVVNVNSALPVWDGEHKITILGNCRCMTRASGFFLFCFIYCCFSWGNSTLDPVYMSIRADAQYLGLLCISIKVGYSR